MGKLIKLDQVTDAPICVLTLNRPEAMNALNQELLLEFLQILEEIDSDNRYYCTIITGSGERAFCAGADLKERRKMTEKEGLAAVKRIGQVFRRVETMRYPVIAAINGVALGGGLELALACDLRVSAEEARLGLTETSLAIIPGAGGTQRLSRLIGVGKAKELIYTATPISGKEALTYGIVEKIVPKEAVLDVALDLARQIVKNGPLALQAAKKAIDYGLEVDLETGLNIEGLCYEQVLYTEDRLEALRAFQEKRQAKFQAK